MSDELKYSVLPNEPEYKPAFPLTESERKNVPGLERYIAVIVWAFTFVLGIFASLFLILSLGFTSNSIVIIGAIIGIASASFIVRSIASSTRNKNILNIERWRTRQAEAAYQNEVRRTENEAASLTSNVSRTYESSSKLATELRQHLNQASRLLQDAENEYNSNAFAPFWDAVEKAARHLSDFNDKTKSLSRCADDYYRHLNGRRHTFPVFPVQIRTIPDASSVVKEFRRIVRMGQTNFQFANIWEHRRTREVLIAGFRTLGEAVNNLGATLENSIYSLQESVSSDLAKVRVLPI